MVIKAIGARRDTRKCAVITFVWCVQQQQQQNKKKIVVFFVCFRLSELNDSHMRVRAIAHASRQRRVI